MSRLALLPPVPVDADAAARNVRLLSILRALAIGGQLAAILFVSLVLGVWLPLEPMLAALAVLVALNLGVAQIARSRTISGAALFATMLGDVACLSVQLWLSGGLGNPFSSLYLLQVVIAAVLLPRWASWSLVALTAALFALLARSPYPLPDGYGAVLSVPYAVAAWFGYVLTAVLLVLFVTRIVGNLAKREAHLSSLRQRAAEEEHVVRIGLLASGAAHELGTPLASLAVTLGDWRADPVIARLPDLAADVAAMAGEVARCKQILGQVLLAAGEVRGDTPTRTTLRRFVADTVGEWTRQRGVPVQLRGPVGGERPIVADRPLAQAISNLLDNAVEAGAGSLAVTTRIDGTFVELTVCDDGQGFAADMLRDVGRNPYRSTKGRTGAGLGLFLASNVLRTLGGRLAARNLPAGGAEVMLIWPLAALAAS